MDEFTIFTAALNLRSPWFIEQVYMKDTEQGEELHIRIGHQKMSKFDYEGGTYSVYDHQPRTWRHLDFFQHHCYLHAKMPRVKTQDGDVRLIGAAWAEPGSSFTLLFELKMMELVYNGMTQSKAGKTLNIDGKRVGRVISRRVGNALCD